MPGSAAIGNLAVNLTMETAAFTDGATQAQTQMRALSGEARKMGGAVEGTAVNSNNARIAQLELMHAVRGSVDSFASGTPVTQIFAQHVSMVAQAASLAGSGLGAMGSFLAGPWGLAVTAAVSVGALFVGKLFETKEGVDGLVKKLQDHHDKTELSNEADKIWSQTVDGLGEKIAKTTEQIAKRIETQSRLNDVLMQTAENEYAAALAQEAAGKAASDNVTKAAIALHQAQLGATESAAEASTNLSKAAENWIDAERRYLQLVTTAHPELTTNEGITTAVQMFNDAAKQAAAAGMQFGGFTSQVHALDTGLLNSSLSADTFAAKMRAITASLRASTAAFKDQDNAIGRFKQAVIGAEGTGQNRLGSSAAGFGQFMPSTWEHYIKQLFPQMAASMTKQQIDDLRNNKQVALAVIDAATKDYENVLKAAGQQITEAALYTVHLLGAGDAKKFFAASPGTQTSSFLSAGVLAGNPFLRGTVGAARASIARRIGDSSGAVSSGAAAINEELNKQIELWERIHAGMSKALLTDVDISDEITKQKSLVGGSAEAMASLKSGISSVEAELKPVADMFAARQDELLHFADQFGSAIASVVTGTESLKDAFSNLAKSIISDLIQMSIKMLIFRALTSAFGNFFGPTNDNTPDFSALYGASDVPGFASGGSGVFGGFGGIDQNVLSLNGSPIARVSKGEPFSVGGAANSNSRLIVELRDEMLDARIADGANVQIVRSYPAVKAGVVQHINEAGRRRS